MFRPSVAVVVLLLPLTYVFPRERVRPGGLPDPRTQPLTVADALFSIPGITGHMHLVGDLDHDGRRDLIAERGGDWDSFHGSSETVHRIDAISTLDGHTIRTLWESPYDESRWPPRRIVWDACGDCDGDGLPDVLIGLPEWEANGPNSGRVLVVSGADGRVVRDSLGAAKEERLGWAVAFLDDLDDDGHCDYAVGSPQSDVWPIEPPDASPLCGRVSMYSGRTDRMLWRVEGTLPGNAFGARVEVVGDGDRDGHADLLVGSDPRSSQPLLLVAGRTGEVFGTLPDNGGPFGAAGDLDEDGSEDVYLDVMSLEQYHDRHRGETSSVSMEGRVLHTFKFPDWGWASSYSITIPLGDVTGDGVPDFLLGEANYHIPGPGDPGWEWGVEPVDLMAMNLTDALALEPDPWCAMTWESGAAWVYSGRTKRVILGAWGLPASRDGVGLDGSPIPDLTGDGFPEIAICDSTGAHVFAGPGPDPLHEPK